MSEPRSPLVRALGVEGGVLCAVGAGGKKTLLYRLAREAPGRVALTATVHTPPFGRHLDASAVDADPLPRLRARLDAEPGARVWGVARPSEKTNRWAGLRPDEVDALAEMRAFDWILVKADGARFRWIKAPAEDEPAVPASAALVLPVASARAIGRPLDDKVAHRPDAFARLTGAAVGRPIEPRHVAALLAHPEGALKNAGAAGVLPILNMVDDAETEAAAREAAEEALRLTGRFDRVLLACLTAEDPVVAAVTRT